jgi:predicted kinase
VRRISVVGVPGSGKSRLARELATFIRIANRPDARRLLADAARQAGPPEGAAGSGRALGALWQP